jgi:S1-C subfamily serine protease
LSFSIVRRNFIALVAVAAAWPHAAQAQPPATADVCGSIGVRVLPMTAAFADSLGMTERYGAIFDRPRPGGPAAMAGIQAYDVVTAINGSPLKSWRDFAPIISRFSPNTTLWLTAWRNRQLIEVRVVLGSGACPGRPTKAR